MIIIFALMFFIGYSAHGQNNSNYIDIVTNTSLNWSINTLTEMENTQTKSNGIIVQVKNRNSTRSVYARISNFTVPPGFYPDDSPLYLDYTWDNSNNHTNLITTPLIMTTTAQRLFTHRQHSNNSEYSFYYDVQLAATNWDYPPGTYTFTLEFTFY
jgi:hypothetical protein